MIDFTFKYIYYQLNEVSDFISNLSFLIQNENNNLNIFWLALFKIQLSFFKLHL